MGYLNINNCKVIGDRTFSSKQNIKIAKHLNLKLDGNHYQVNSDSMKGVLQKDLRIFHQNIRGLKGKTEEIMNNIEKIHHMFFVLQNITWNFINLMVFCSEVIDLWLTFVEQFIDMVGSVYMCMNLCRHQIWRF